MKKYRTIFFDLDHTIWDFHTNARITINEMFDHFDLGGLGFKEGDEVYRIYATINESLWQRYREHQIDKATLRDERFMQLLRSVDVDDPLLAREMNDFYVTVCRQKTNLIAGARDVLSALQSKYPLHIISNGFREAQYLKLRNCGLEQYFRSVILSDEVGFHKPQPGIFQEALNKTRSEKDSSIYIGDHLETDIIGAINFGIDVVYFNPDRIEHEIGTTYEINHLSELLYIL